MNPPRAALYRYIPIPYVDDALRLGWMATMPGMMHMHHSFWSVACFWLCDCEAVVPAEMRR